MRMHMQYSAASFAEIHNRHSSHNNYMHFLWFFSLLEQLSRAFSKPYMLPICLLWTFFFLTHRTRLVSLAAQKFVADIAHEALQQAKMRNMREKGRKDQRLVMTAQVRVGVGECVGVVDCIWIFVGVDSVCVCFC
jgi:Na+/alanine symporter